VHEVRVELTRLAAPEPKGVNALHESAGPQESCCTERQDGARSDPSERLAHPLAHPSDPALAIELALSTALERASAAGEWAVVAKLAGELEARRRAQVSSVVNLEEARSRRGR
jgi:hypothetical protein